MISIVTEPESRSWILRRCAEELAARVEDAEIGPAAAPADLTYFINYALWRPCSSPTAALFTHREEYSENGRLYLEVIGKVDAAVFMNRTMAAHARKLFPGLLSAVIRPGSDPRLNTRQPLFGLVGRVYKSGRKGEALARRMKEAGFQMVAWGTGWPVSGSKDFEDIPRFYQSIDYLVITSTNEGGPIPLIDAMAANVPVIAPQGVGWCDEFPCIRYQAGNWFSLRSVLQTLTAPPTWEQWADKHRLFFDSVLGSKRAE